MKSRDILRSYLIYVVLAPYMKAIYIAHVNGQGGSLLHGTLIRKEMYFEGPLYIQYVCIV